MPVATSEQYALMLDRALAGTYGLPAVNVTSSQVLNGVLHGLAAARSDGIVQVTVGARYLGDGGALAGARAYTATAREFAAPLGVLVGVHTDHRRRTRSTPSSPRCSGTAPSDELEASPRPSTRTRSNGSAGATAVEDERA